MAAVSKATECRAGFLPVENNNHDEKGWFSIAKLNNKYPGFTLRSSCSDEIIFSDDAENSIIEVLGKRSQGAKNDRKASRIIAILRGSDSKLYYKLQWLHAGRHHGTVQWAKSMLCVALWLPLFIIQQLAGIIIYWPVSFSNAILIMIASALLAVLEIIGFIAVKRLIRIIFGLFDVLIAAYWNLSNDKEKTRAYYKELFQTLASANCRDKAKAAKLISKFF